MDAGLNNDAQHRLKYWHLAGFFDGHIDSFGFESRNSDSNHLKFLHKTLDLGKNTGDFKGIRYAYGVDSVRLPKRISALAYSETSQRLYIISKEEDEILREAELPKPGNTLTKPLIGHSKVHALKGRHAIDVIESEGKLFLLQRERYKLFLSIYQVTSDGIRETRRKDFDLGISWEEFSVGMEVRFDVAVVSDDKYYLYIFSDKHKPVVVWLDFSGVSFLSFPDEMQSVSFKRHRLKGIKKYIVDPFGKQVYLIVREAPRVPINIKKLSVKAGDFAVDNITSMASIELQEKDYIDPVAGDVENYVSSVGVCHFFVDDKGTLYSICSSGPNKIIRFQSVMPSHLLPLDRLISVPNIGLICVIAGFEWTLLVLPSYGCFLSMPNNQRRIEFTMQDSERFS